MQRLYKFVCAVLSATLLLALPVFAQGQMPAAEPPVPQLTEWDQNLLTLIESGKLAEAKAAVQSELSKNVDAQRKAELLNLMAYIDHDLKNNAAAVKDLKSLPDLTGPGASRRQAVTLKRIGDLYLQMGKESNALAQYKSAFALSQFMQPNDPIISELLDPLVGSLIEQGDYKQARPYAEQLLSVCKARASSGDLLDAGALLWAYIQVLEIYGQIDHDAYTKLRGDGLDLLQQLLSLRSKLEGKTIEEDREVYAKIQHDMLRQYVAENRPATLGDYLWTVSEYRQRSLPLLNKLPAEGPPKAIILCIHALGLENRAYIPFARMMAARQYGIYALDVRGFGAWQTEFGTESVNFDRALSDIRGVIGMIKALHPGVPVFILGESMGGAIVLRCAAEFGNEVDGVISSVPSAERYKEGKMVLRVAFNFIRDPHKPFDIGTQIADQATSRTELRHIWKGDPKSKINMSPIELMKFDKFMRTTQRQCDQIKKTPVMLVQGLADQLVKPKGSYEMFDNISSQDKVMIIIGNAEHLIFETPEQSTVLLQGLSAWIDKHVELKN